MLSLLAAALLLVCAPAQAQTLTTVNENLALSSNTFLMDTDSPRLDVGTVAYTGAVPGVVLFVSSNMVIGTGTGANSEVVIYATGSVMALGVRLGAGGGATGWTATAPSGNVYLTTATNNVGIGTTGPESKLHVIGSVGANAYQAKFTTGWSYTDDAYGGFEILSKEAAAGDRMEASFLLYGGSAAQRRMVIYGYDNAGAAFIPVTIPYGNFGIGTVSPDAKLAVSGTAALNTTLAAGTQLYYCNGGASLNTICRGSGCTCVGGTETGLGIYVP